MLVKCLRDAWKHVAIVGVDRKYWSEQAGFEFLTQLVFDDEERTPTIVAAKAKYVAIVAPAQLSGARLPLVDTTLYRPLRRCSNISNLLINLLSLRNRSMFDSLLSKATCSSIEILLSISNSSPMHLLLLLV